jgi:hypothetical protein
MMNHESPAAIEADTTFDEQSEGELALEADRDALRISAETVQPATLAEYYDNCIGMGDGEKVIDFKDEDEFYRETGFRFSDLNGSASGL